MFSFQALLSTALSGSYSQGLIHRKASKGRFPGRRNPLKQKESVRHWGKFSEKEGTDRHEWPVCEQRRGYLPMQKLEKIRPNRSSELKAPVISPKECCA
ncbi:hypothetical protein FQ192_15235 [Pseudomonas sp. ANT_J12]|nr:hypothetical protein FQ192_15235 [Pseudomonas sp. ANT_J12]